MCILFVFYWSPQKASFFPILRLILPKKDTERDAHGIKRKRLGDLYVKALAINENSSTGRKLTGADVSTKGDFGDVVFNVMKDRQPEGTLTIYDVNECLNQLSAKSKGTYTIFKWKSEANIFFFGLR